MRYIIELPEEVKEKFDNATKDDIYGSYYDYNSVIGNAIKNSTPLSEELERIKADIKEWYWLLDAYGNIITQNNVEAIIDEHISELKGEKGNV